MDFLQGMVFEVPYWDDSTITKQKTAPDLSGTVADCSLITDY